MEKKSSLRKNIVIIKSRPGALSSVEQFLRNREWVLHSSDEIKEALQMVVKHQPQFVLVAMDHPDHKIRSLPKILVQAFPVCVIGYAEKATTESYRLLSESHCEYKVNPPIAGPGIERAVSKFLKDQNQQKKDPRNVLAQGGAPGQKNSGFESVRIDHGKSQGPDIINIQGSQAKKNEFTLDGMTAVLNALNGASSNKVNSSGQTQKPSIEQGPIATKPSGGDGPNAPADSSALSSKANNPQGMILGENDQKNSQMLPPHENEKPAEFPLPSLDREAPNSTSQLSMNSGPGAPIFGGSNSDNEASRKEIMAAATEKAMRLNSDSGDGRVFDPVKATSQVTCIRVNSQLFKGYLVAAMGKNRKLDQGFLNHLKMKLFAFLQEKGIEVEDSPNLEVKLTPVAFEDWSMECANFLRKSVHRGSELAMAFFPAASVDDSKLENSILADMGSVKMDELIAEVDLEFNLYIYMPTNRKYVLYTPRGAKFYGNQKDRLQGLKVTHMHMRRSETQGLSQYRVKNFLNEIIRNYHVKKKQAA